MVELARRARTILEVNCHRCHGLDGTNEGGLNFILRHEKLVSGGYVLPGNADESYLFQRVVDGDMPPAGEEPRCSDQDIAVLKQWISAGAPPFEQAAQREFIANEALIESIADDLRNASERDRPFLRYFTITHLHNAGFSDEELQTYRLALAKLLNSLSWNRELVRLTPVDAAETVLRIDFRDLKWTERQWDATVAANPYGVVYDSSAARFCYQATACRLPHVRGDWFVAAASRPPLYHTLLQLPQTAAELERLLHVDVRENIRQEQVARAGFVSSGVSKNNRLIERHDSPYGAYWKSYDFASNVGRKNLLKYPLGPGPGSGTFEHDGGEIIFSLPNGLQGYLLVDGQGRRIDVGPIDVVRDRSELGPEVINGLSCMSCHYGGIIPKHDEVRETVVANRNAYPDAEDILALYPPHAAWESLIAEDRERFEKAVNELGITRITRTGEPVVNMALRFAEELDLPLAAAELGLRPEDFLERLRQSPQLGRELGALHVPGGTIKRDVFVKLFAAAIEGLAVGGTLLRRAPHVHAGTAPQADSYTLRASVSEPQLVNLTELNAGPYNASPWLSEDGLTIYWESAAPGGGSGSWIWMAQRKTLHAPFQNRRPLLPGRHPTLTADQCEVVCLAEGAGGETTLHAASRASIDSPFSSPREIPAFRSQQRVKNPCLSPDGLTLYFNRWNSREAKTEVCVSTRRSLNSPWEAPQRLLLGGSPPDRDGLTWPFPLRGDSTLLACHEGATGKNRIVLLSRDGRNSAFGNFRYLQVPEIGTLSGRSPRYVPHTRELFFTAPRTLGAAAETPWPNHDLWVLKNCPPELLE